MKKLLQLQTAGAGLIAVKHADKIRAHMQVHRNAYKEDWGQYDEVSSNGTPFGISMPASKHSNPVGSCWSST
jgi:hypothetical protein